MSKEELINELSKINISLDSEKLEIIDKYINFLLQENAKTNLTAIKDLENIYLKHIYDSLTISKIIDLNEYQTLLDIGSGAGFPGLILKIVYPGLKIVLLDSNNKKTTFLENAINFLKLENIEVINKRAEDYIKEKREFFDIVTARAVTRLNVLAELAIPFIKVGGIFVAMKANALEELTEGKSAIEKLNCNISEIQEFELPIENSKRTLIRVEKLQTTPSMYPRLYDKIIKNSLK